MAPSTKIKRILGLILIGCLGIALRAWHLGVIQRDAKWLEAQKPQSRTILVRADRGTICDRFQIPLAINRICYHASIYYDQIAQIPAIRWQEDSSGKRVRTWPRREYIQQLSEMLAKELQMEAARIEDLIYSKASLFPHAPYIIKTGLSETEHYRLKGLERDWPGVYAEIAAERFYPQGKTACHIIGTMGAISQKKYREIVAEQKILQEAAVLFEQGSMETLPSGYESLDAVYRRLYELKEKAYRLSDLVGKTGIEIQFEEELRGFAGKNIFEVDQKGRLIRELPGSARPVSGRQMTLSLSIELQQFAEELLATSEKEREGRSFGIDPIDKVRKKQKQPWIKGGAIVAIDPNNGEVVAMASYPRFDPNDFIPVANPSSRKERQKRLSRWLEDERYTASLWDGRDRLYRERFNRRFFEEEALLTWDFYLNLILPEDGPLQTFFQKVCDVKSAIQIQEDFETLCYFCKPQTALQIAELFGRPSSIAEEARPAFRRLDAHLGPIFSPKDRLFAIDLCRLAVDSTRFSDELIEQAGPLSLNAYRALCMDWIGLESTIQEKYRLLFHQEQFSDWRKENQAAFLAKMRKKEKNRKTYARPYLDYLDKKEAKLFAKYWENHRLSILQNHLEEKPSLLAAIQAVSPELVEEFLRTFRSFKQLDRTLLGTYKKFKTEKDLAKAILPPGGFGSIRSYAFQNPAPQGSFFKLITAYEGLRQGHSLSLVDHRGKDPKFVAYDLSGSPFPRIYKGGRLPQSSGMQLGKIDLIGALEKSSNPYFSILAGDYLTDPEDLKNTAAQFGYGEKSGIDLPAESRGNLPTDLKRNRTSLYSFAIGQHTLLSTPLQSAIALAALGNGGKVLKPKIVLASKGLALDREELSIFSIKNSFLEEELQTLGIPFSPFTGIQSKPPIAKIAGPQTEVRRTLPLPKTIRSQLFEGMDRSLWSASGGARAGIIRLLHAHPALAADYRSLEHQMIGKTSTAQILFNPNANPSSPAQMVKHTWFSSLSFQPDSVGKVQFEHPELVVVVFFRFGDAGKEAAPIAAQMIKKWREIKAKYPTASDVGSIYADRS